MIKIIIIIIIVIFIVLPLYRGDSVDGVINRISNTITSIKNNTPTWAKELIGKVFSISLRLVKAVFNTLLDIIFEEAGREVNKELNGTKEKIKDNNLNFLENSIQLL